MKIPALERGVESLKRDSNATMDRLDQVLIRLELSPPPVLGGGGLAAVGGGAFGRAVALGCGFPSDDFPAPFSPLLCGDPFCCCPALGGEPTGI